MRGTKIDNNETHEFVSIWMHSRLQMHRSLALLSNIWIDI